MQSRLLKVDQVSLICINSSVQGYSINHPFRSVKNFIPRPHRFKKTLAKHARTGL